MKILKIQALNVSDVLMVVKIVYLTRRKIKQNVINALKVMQLIQKKNVNFVIIVANLVKLMKKKTQYVQVAKMVIHLIKIISADPAVMHA